MILPEALPPFSSAEIDAPEGERLFLKHLSDWISVGSLRVKFDLRLDALSATMILVVTGIGTLIHVYAIG